MSTIATRKQSEAIRKQMRGIRCELPYAMDDARNDLKQLGDWKFYVRKMPLTTVAAVATAAFVAVPRPRSVAHLTNGQFVTDEPEAGKTFVAGLVGSLAAMALRTATTMAVRQASCVFLNQAQQRSKG
jgi:hypothetical protein